MVPQRVVLVGSALAWEGTGWGRRWMRTVEVREEGRDRGGLPGGIIWIFRWWRGVRYIVFV